MGTSASVSGAGPGSPLIPDWVEEIGEEDGDAPPDDTTQDQAINPVPLIPERRLSRARTALGEFASSGDGNSMRSGVGHYIRSGRGGADMATRRSAGSARRAATLGGITSGDPAYDQIRDRIREALSSDGDAHHLLGAIAAVACPIDGTLDSETGQQSASEALRYVLDQFPNADLLALNPIQRETLLERFLALDCFNLFYTETGKHIQQRCDLSTAADRIDEIKSYFCLTFRQANERRRESGSPSLGKLSDRKITGVCRAIIRDAYIIFEVYLGEG